MTSIIRSLFGRSAVDQKHHENQFRRLRTEIINITQAKIDGLLKNYGHDDIKQSISKNDGVDKANEYMQALLFLQFSLVREKEIFLTKRFQDTTNDIESIEDEAKAWEEQMEDITNKSQFKALAKELDIEDMQSASVIDIQRSTRDSVSTGLRKAA